MRTTEAILIGQDPNPVDRERLNLAAVLLAKMAEQQNVLLTAARDLHVPDGALDCIGCTAAVGFGDVGDPHIQWPCATAKALGTPRVEMTVRWDPA